MSTMQEVEISPKISLFLERNKNFIESKRVTSQGVTVVLKRSAVADKIKYDEIATDALGISATKTFVPPGFIIPIPVATSDPETHQHEHDPTSVAYSLAASREGLGELTPVLKDAHGNIIDGFHRLGENANWHSVTVPTIDNPVKLELARLAVNFDRRSVTPQELTQRIEYLIKAGLKPSEIAKLTGITERTIFKYMPLNLKDPAKVEQGAKRPEHVTEAVQFTNVNSISTIIHEPKIEVPTTPDITENKTDESITAEIIQGWKEDGAKILAKNERHRDKIVAAGSIMPPEPLMKAVYGYLDLHGKATSDKANEYASTIIAVLYQKCVDKKLFVVNSEGEYQLFEPEGLFKEADGWQ